MYTDGKLKVIGSVNTSGTEQALLTFGEGAWEADQRRKVNKNFADTHSLWLQQHSESHDDFLHTVNMLDSYNNIEFNKHWIPLFDQVATIVGGTVVRALVIRMAPGCVIQKHMDGLHKVFKYCNRIILPITSNDQPFLFYDDESFVLDAGVLYDSNGFVPHWAVNNGSSNVYIAIFDVLPANENAVTVQEHPNNPASWAWLKENTIRKSHDNKIMSNWEKWLEEERLRKSGQDTAL